MNLFKRHTDLEADLVMACKKRDPQAQKQLFMQYADEMLVVCIRYVGNPELAKEVMMDAFVKCFDAIKDFEYRGEGSLRAWLKRIVISFCLMQLRKQKLQFVDIEATKWEYEYSAEDIVGGISAKEILLLINDLPQGCRAVFNLYVFDNKTHKEIGELLGISDGTSKSQLAMARKILKEKILQSV